jgi:hypothetical protein
VAGALVARAASATLQGLWREVAAELALADLTARRAGGVAR